MDFDKGRGRKVAWNTDIPEDTLDSRLKKLCEMKMELRSRSKAFKESTKHLRESIKSMEEIITDEVMKLGKTVAVDNIKAEYRPQVIFKLKKEQSNGE